MSEDEGFKTAIMWTCGVLVPMSVFIMWHLGRIAHALEVLAGIK